MLKQIFIVFNVCKICVKNVIRKYITKVKEENIKERR